MYSPKSPPSTRRKSIHSQAPPKTRRLKRRLSPRVTTVRTSISAPKKSAKSIPFEHQTATIEQSKFNSQLLATIRSLRDSYASPATTTPTKNVILQPPLKTPRIASLQQFILILHNSQHFLSRGESPFLKLELALPIYANLTSMFARLDEKPHLFNLQHSAPYKRQKAIGGSFYQRNVDFNLNHVTNILKQQVLNQLTQSGILSVYDYTPEERQVLGYENPNSTVKSTTFLDRLTSFITSKPTPDEIIDASRSPFHPIHLPQPVLDKLRHHDRFHFSLDFQFPHKTHQDFYTETKEELLNGFFPMPDESRRNDMQSLYDAMNGVKQQQQQQQLQASVEESAPTTSSVPKLPSKPTVKFYELELLHQLETKQLIPVPFRVKSKLSTSTLTPIPSSLYPNILRQPEFTALIDQIAAAKATHQDLSPLLSTLKSRLEQHTSFLLAEITSDLNSAGVSTNPLNSMPLFLSKETFKSTELTIPELNEPQQKQCSAIFHEEFQTRHQKASNPFENPHKFPTSDFNSNYLDHLYSHLSSIGSLPTSIESSTVNTPTENIVSLPQESILSFLDSNSTQTLINAGTIKHISTSPTTGLSIYIPTQHLATIPSKQQHLDAFDPDSNKDLSYKQSQGYHPQVLSKHAPKYISPVAARKLLAPTTFLHDMTLRTKHLFALPHDLTFLREIVANPVVFQYDIYTHFEYTEPVSFKKFTNAAITQLKDMKDIIEVNFMVYSMLSQAIYNKYFNLIPSSDPGIALLTPGFVPKLLQPNSPSTDASLLLSPEQQSTLKRLQMEAIDQAPDEPRFLYTLPPSQATPTSTRFNPDPHHLVAVQNQLLFTNPFYIHHLASTEEERIVEKVHFNMLMKNPQLNDTFANIVAMKYHHEQEQSAKELNSDTATKLNIDTTFFLNSLFNTFSPESLLSVSQQHSKYTQKAINDFIADLSKPQQHQQHQQHQQQSQTPPRQTPPKQTTKQTAPQAK